MKLYELNEQLWDLVDMADVPPSAEPEIEDTWLGDVSDVLLGDDRVLEEVAANFETKVDACCGFLRQLEANLEALANERKRFQERERALKLRIQRFKDYVVRCLTSLPHGKDGKYQAWKTELHKVRLQKSPISVANADVDQLPRSLTRTKIEPDGKAILDFYRSYNQAPPGATINDNSYHLRID